MSWWKQIPPQAGPNLQQQGTEVPRSKSSQILPEGSWRSLETTTTARSLISCLCWRSARVTRYTAREQQDFWAAAPLTEEAHAASDSGFINSVAQWKREKKAEQIIAGKPLGARSSSEGWVGLPRYHAIPGLSSWCSHSFQPRSSPGWLAESPAFLIIHSRGFCYHSCVTDKTPSCSYASNSASMYLYGRQWGSFCFHQRGLHQD